MDLSDPILVALAGIGGAVLLLAVLYGLAYALVTGGDAVATWWRRRGARSEDVE